jgi:carbon storage regulator CsrA
MLVMTRRVNEGVVVGDHGAQVEVVVVGVDGARVQLGFRDRQDGQVRVVRTELVQAALDAADAAAAEVAR